VIRVRAVAPLLVATVLTVMAVLTVRGAGCEDPGRYEPRPGGYELVGGCIAPGDMVVPHRRPTEAPVDLDRPARG